MGTGFLYQRMAMTYFKRRFCKNKKGSYIFFLSTANFIKKYEIDYIENVTIAKNICSRMIKKISDWKLSQSKKKPCWEEYCDPNRKYWIMESKANNYVPGSPFLKTKTVYAEIKKCDDHDIYEIALHTKTFFIKNSIYVQSLSVAKQKCIALVKAANDFRIS